jgi:hypothetical protein
MQMSSQLICMRKVNANMFTLGLGAGLLGMYPCSLDRTNEKLFWEHSSAHRDSALLWSVGQKSIRSAGLKQTYPDNLDACHPDQGIVLRPCVHYEQSQESAWVTTQNASAGLAAFLSWCITGMQDGTLRSG